MAVKQTKAARRNLKDALNGIQDAQQEWEVEEILGERKGKNNVTEFLVKWKDFEGQDTWETEDKLANAKSLIAAFRRKKNKKTAASARKQKSRPMKRSSVSQQDDEEEDKKQFRKKQKQVTKLKVQSLMLQSEMMW